MLYCLARYLVLKGAVQLFRDPSGSASRNAASAHADRAAAAAAADDDDDARIDELRVQACGCRRALWARRALCARCRLRTRGTRDGKLRVASRQTRACTCVRRLQRMRAG